MNPARTVIAPIAARLRRHPLLGRLALMVIPDWHRTIRIDGIGPFLIRLRRHRAYWLRDPLSHDRDQLDALQQLIEPGDTVWDVGSNIGMYVRFECAFKAGRVIAFEPMSENRSLLERNVELGNLGGRVMILPCALSDVTGREELQIDDVQSGTAALDSVAGGRASEGRAALGLGPRTETVECRTADGLIAEEAAPSPDVMKIDVEGAEEKVLAGAERLLKERSPRLLIELHGVEPARAVCRRLLELGYVIHARSSPRLGDRHDVPVDEAFLQTLQHRYDLLFIVARQSV